MRQQVRVTAGKVQRSEELQPGEKEAAASFLRENPAFGNPHVVRCGWCHQTRTLFRDEDDALFARIAHGWRCQSCDVRAASQEVRL